MSKAINIITTNKCQLRCPFCINSFLRSKIDEDVFSYEEFVKTIDKLIVFGFDTFDLTPNVGDIFVDPNIMDKITYLENNDKVKHYEFVTNFLGATMTDIYQLIHTTKCECAISIYGYDEESYKSTTGVNAFKQFDSKFNALWSKTMDYENADPFMFYMRHSKYEDFPSSATKRSMEHMIEWGATLENAELVNRNWGGLMGDNVGVKKGICSRLLKENGVYPNGDITACNCWDWDKEMLIGNLNEQTLEEIYSMNSPFGQLLAEQFKNNYFGPCIKCDDFNRVRKQDLQFDWTKLYELFYK